MATNKEPPPCARVRKWLLHNYGRDVLAPLTGTDARALEAFVHVLELRAYSGRSFDLNLATVAIIDQMQESTRWLAKASIPMILDWPDEDRLWEELFPGHGALPGARLRKEG